MLRGNALRAARPRPEPARADEAPRTAARLGRLMVVATLLYVALLAAVLLYTKNWPTSDQVALGLLLLAVLSGRGLAFVRDWSPFVLLVLAYEALRGFADGLVAGVHVQFAIDADRAMFFGHLPTVWLQQRLWDPQHLHWYDYVAAYLHPMHFIAPLGLAFVLWLLDRRLYWKFVASYVLLSYAGFVTYLLFPAAPPWWASDAGRIPHVDTILDHVLWQHGSSHPIALVYQYFESNPVAAIPSLHAAFPVLAWLVAWRVWPRWGWALVLYPLAMGWAVVYMGEHYVIDVLIGYAYGAAAFWAVWVAPGWWARTRMPVGSAGAAGG